MLSTQPHPHVQQAGGPRPAQDGCSTPRGHAEGTAGQGLGIGNRWARARHHEVRQGVGSRQDAAQVLVVVTEILGSI